MLVLLLAATLAGCERHGLASATAASPAPAASPYATIANGKVDVEGGIIEVAARRAGIVSEVYVQEGAAVHKGELLARLEDKDSVLAVKSARAAVAQARSQVALTEVTIRAAQRELERLTRLQSASLVSQQQLDQASDALATARAQLDAEQAAVRTTEAQLEQAGYNEDLTLIRAPSDGKIVRRYANPGAGASTLQVSNMFDLEPALPRIVRAEIVETAIPDVHVGQRVQIVSEADPAKTASGTVRRMAATFGARKLKSDSATEATDERVVEVVVATDDDSFLIGQRVLVKFMKSTAKDAATGASPPGARTAGTRPAGSR
jgi:HlyD family secretion protein